MSNRRFIIGGVTAAIVAATAGAAPALADVISAADPNNVALISDGASFVAASSYNQAVASPAALTIMQNNPISGASAAPWPNSGDTRYVFTDPWDGSGNPPSGDQTYEIKLGGLYDLDSFAVTWSTADGPRLIGGIAVSVSTDGVNFTALSGSVTSSPSPEISYETVTTLTVSPVEAEYVLYDFGFPTGVANGGEQTGSAFYAVLADKTPGGGGASAVPEPSTWAMLLLGFAGIGVMVRRSARANAAPVA